MGGRGLLIHRRFFSNIFIVTFCISQTRYFVFLDCILYFLKVFAGEVERSSQSCRLHSTGEEEEGGRLSWNEGQSEKRRAAQC